MDIIAEKLKSLPENSGVYIMLDSDKRVIYIGKARILKNRVRQYFHSSVSFNDKTLAMVSKIADFNYIITNTEADALGLEANLIKKYKPQYNILLKDDKHFPYITVNLKEDFPILRITRKIKKDGSKYFGPYMGGVRASELLLIITDAFPVKLCNLNLLRVSKNHRPCLNFHIGKCLAPCRGNITKEEYKDLILKACNFLNGNDEEIKQVLTEKMYRLSESEQYEAAASIRDRLKMLDKLKAKKLSALTQKVNLDVFSYHTNGKYGAISLLIIRDGNMEGVKSFSVSDAGIYDEDTVSSFLTQFYTGNAMPPNEILVDTKIDTEAIKAYLSELFKRNIKVTIPLRGDKKKMTDMAHKNAEEYLYKYIEKIKHTHELTQGAVAQLSETLNLKKLPLKMECYDISHISGIDKTASMVVFVNGESQPSLYRRFKIKTVEGNDDFASMAEVIKRRFEKYKNNESNDDSFMMLPDLVVIDGGLGQLNSALKILQQLEIDTEIISLAKREEEIYTINSKEPVVLSKSSLAIRLLQRIRDEAHRFALSYHRKLREKHISSELDNIEGIGEKKRKALIALFGSLENIKKADIFELIKTDGIDTKLAENIINYFKAKAEKDK